MQHRHVSAIVTTAGGVEEDLIKCLAPTYLGAFELDGATLRAEGMNRIGNLLAPNDNYCAFKDWVMPVLDAMLAEQDGPQAAHWTPSRIIEWLGREIADESSVCYWAARNGIPIFSPALTDCSLGNMLHPTLSAAAPPSCAVTSLPASAASTRWLRARPPPASSCSAAASSNTTSPTPT